MDVKRVQRTLIVGLGEPGGLAARALAARLGRELGPAGLMEAIVVESGETVDGQEEPGFGWPDGSLPVTNLGARF